MKNRSKFAWILVFLISVLCLVMSVFDIEVPRALDAIFILSVFCGVLSTLYDWIMGKGKKRSEEK